MLGKRNYSLTSCLIILSCTYMYKINILLKQNQKVFHTNDLAILWGITNKNTLYTTIKRYVRKNILIPIQKGFYSIVPIENIDPVRLALGILHRFAYVSCETVLAQNGVIFQKGEATTLVSDISRKFMLHDKLYIVRKLKDEYLFNDLGIENRDGLYYANLERAAADMLYFNPLFYFDNQKAIDWKKVREIQKVYPEEHTRRREVGYL